MLNLEGIGVYYLLWQQNFYFSFIFSNVLYIVSLLWYKYLLYLFNLALEGNWSIAHIRSLIDTVLDE